MADLGITTLWEGLRDAGVPEVMLYLPEGAACRCHWNDTAVLDGTRVALLGDQERNIVRIIPVESCVGLGIPSPKGVDPVGYRSIIRRSWSTPDVTATQADEATRPAWKACRMCIDRQPEAVGCVRTTMTRPDHPTVQRSTTSRTRRRFHTFTEAAADPPPDRG